MTVTIYLSHHYPTKQVVSNSGKIYLVHCENDATFRIYHDPAGLEATRKQLDALLGQGDESTISHKIIGAWSDVESWITAQEPVAPPAQ